MHGLACVDQWLWQRVSASMTSNSGHNAVIQRNWEESEKVIVYMTRFYGKIMLCNQSGSKSVSIRLLLTPPKTLNSLLVDLGPSNIESSWAILG